MKTRRLTLRLNKIQRIHPTHKHRQHITGGKKTRISHNGLTKMSCSPKNGPSNDFSCYTNEALFTLKDKWNSRHPDTIIHSNNPKEIWELLGKYMNKTCRRESCWLIQDFAKGEMDELKQSFAPASPKEWKKNPNEWLSSVDIMAVMKQYEKVYKCFDFFGPTPIDFDTKETDGVCVWEEICNLNLRQQQTNGKTKLGFIFNTDPHYKGGEHWISLFVNIKKGTIFFFDSAGNDIPREVQVLVDRIIKQGKELNIHFKFDKNYPVEHQYGNTECGVYSLFFIVHMLEDKITGNYLKTHILKDKYMEKFRKVYFNSVL
jgi:hypothetical protein